MSDLQTLLAACKAANELPTIMPWVEAAETVREAVRQAIMPHLPEGVGVHAYPNDDHSAVDGWANNPEVPGWEVRRHFFGLKSLGQAKAVAKRLIRMSPEAAKALSDAYDRANDDGFEGCPTCGYTFDCAECLALGLEERLEALGALEEKGGGA